MLALGMYHSCDERAKTDLLSNTPQEHQSEEIKPGSAVKDVDAAEKALEILLRSMYHVAAESTEKSLFDQKLEGVENCLADLELEETCLVYTVSKLNSLETDSSRILRYGIRSSEGHAVIASQYEVDLFFKGLENERSCSVMPVRITDEGEQPCISNEKYRHGETFLTLMIHASKRPNGQQYLRDLGLDGQMAEIGSCLEEQSTSFAYRLQFFTTDVRELDIDQKMERIDMARAALLELGVMEDDLTSRYADQSSLSRDVSRQFHRIENQRAKVLNNLIEIGNYDDAFDVIREFEPEEGYYTMGFLGTNVEDPYRFSELVDFAERRRDHPDHVLLNAGGYLKDGLRAFRRDSSLGYDPLDVERARKLIQDVERIDTRGMSDVFDD